ncbi:hypothetical protein F5Y18DRAFT_424418 [Xylariaceae sp. FL1019]|nr:hypothetical protein F5Y18DRAFT_424418 [Xylariaceae sp. FL1019]
MPRDTWTDGASRALVTVVLELGGLPTTGSFPGGKVKNKVAITRALNDQDIDTTENGVQSQWSRLTKTTDAETGLLIQKIRALPGDDSEFVKAQRIANTIGALEPPPKPKNAARKKARAATSGQQTSSQSNPPSLSLPASSSSGATVQENASVFVAQHDQRQMDGQQGYYDPQYYTREQQDYGMLQNEGWQSMLRGGEEAFGHDQGAYQEEDSDEDTSINDEDEIYPRNYRYPSPPY